MKKILAVAALLLTCLGLFAGNNKVAGGYHSSILDKDFYVFYKGNRAMIYVAGAKSVDRIQFVLKRTDIREFNEALTEAEKIYAIYHEDPARTGTELVDVVFPQITVRWRDLRWHAVRKHCLVPYCSRTPDGQPVLLFGNTLRSGKLTKSYTLVFANIEEMEEFKRLLDKIKF